MTWIHPIIVEGANTSARRIAPTKYANLPAPGNDGFWGTGRQFHIHGPDYLGQRWIVGYGQGPRRSTVDLCPGSWDGVRRRRTTPSIPFPRCPRHPQPIVLPCHSHSVSFAFTCHLLRLTLPPPSLSTSFAVLLHHLPCIFQLFVHAS